MNVKPRPNLGRYLQVLRGMTAEQRAAKSFELSELTKRLFRDGLRRRFPAMPDEDFQNLYLARLEKCHNRNF